jgi:hypothetical protein
MGTFTVLAKGDRPGKKRGTDLFFPGKAVGMAAAADGKNRFVPFFAQQF